MALEFDPLKDAANIAKHGVSLARAADLDILAWLQDDRHPKGEVRYRAWGLDRRRSLLLAFTLRGANVRAISLRRAHSREMNRYAQ